MLPTLINFNRLTALITFKTQDKMSSIVTNTRNKNLKFVDNLSEYKVHHNDVDIRNFKVLSSTGEVIGRVEGLLADVPAKLVRYAEIEINDDVIGRHTAGRYTADDKHALIPIGLVNINASDKTIDLHGIGLTHFIDYPRYNRDYGYTTQYEADANTYLYDFHEYAEDDSHASIRDGIKNGTFSQRDTFDDTFYQSRFYTGQTARRS